MTEERIDALIEEYRKMFGEFPLVNYPQTPYGGIYVKLMKKAISRGEPYTEEELNKALNYEEQDLI